MTSFCRFAAPQPNDFSKKHRFWGRTGMVTMTLAGVSALAHRKQPRLAPAPDIESPPIQLSEKKDS